MFPKVFELFFTTWWLPCLIFLILIATSTLSLLQKRWALGVTSLVLAFGFIIASLFAYGSLIFISTFKTEDGFADNLIIPDGIEISKPEQNLNDDPWNRNIGEGTDDLQKNIKKALSKSGNNDDEIIPDMPSFKKAATDHSRLFLDYLESSPDWHIFREQENLFAVRRWSYGEQPQHELHGYISEFRNSTHFQTRCLICLDCKQCGQYWVQKIQEGKRPIKPKMNSRHNIHESRILIECGGVLLELFEESENPERRITKATLTFLEKEFSELLENPKAKITEAKTRSKKLASNMPNEPFKLISSFQPGIYDVAYSLNPGEPGSIYLRAFEFTKETPLSVERLKANSETRMTWSSNPEEKFSAKVSSIIYEGDWGKPYAARFEVWFKPDSGKPERKLAERIFKIEGWQR